MAVRIREITHGGKERYTLVLARARNFRRSHLPDTEQQADCQGSTVGIVLEPVMENLIPMQNYQRRTKPTRESSTKRNSGNVLMSEESAKRREKSLDCKQELTMHRTKRRNSHYNKTLTGSLIFYRNKMLHIRTTASRTT